MGKLDGRVAIVTGAAHGNKAALGSHYAKALAGEGAKVAISDIRDLGSIAQEITAAGGEVLPLTCDVRDEAQIKAMVDKTVETYGRLDILVNNAAVGANIPPVTVEQLDADEWDNLFAINVRGPFLCTKAAVPHMRKNHYGKVINIGSSMMWQGSPNRLHYVTAKGAVLSMTRALARELGRDGIRVNTFAYGLIMNPSVAEDMQNPEQRQRIVGRRSMPIDILPEDLTATLIYLASPDSDAMTGQVVMVDGGGVNI